LIILPSIAPAMNRCMQFPLKDHTSQGRLRIKPPGNSQDKMIRWASEYIWERHIEEIRPARIELATFRFGAERSIP
jgi:hypothetical protein